MTDDPAAVPDDATLRTYLRGALALHGIDPGPEAIARIEEQFVRLAQIRAIVDRVPLAAGDEPAFQFHP
jgi:hypothetical protein